MHSQWLDKLAVAHTIVEETLSIQFSKSSYAVVSLTCRNDNATDIGITQGYCFSNHLYIISSISITVDCICIGY